MTNLTPKQEKFCQVYLETGNASEAYRQAYNVRPGTSEASINRQAKAQLDNLKISSRLEELRKPAREKAEITLESHLARLRHLSQLAEAAGQYSASIKAEESRGKVAGLYTDRIDHTSSDGSVGPTVIKFVRPDNGNE